MIALLATLLAAAPADCAQAVTQPDMNECASEALLVADAALNRQWRATLHKVRMDEDGSPPTRDSSRERRLRAAQRAWITFRDAHCDSAHYSGIGASLDYTLGITCRVHLTEERTEQLAELARSLDVQ